MTTACNAHIQTCLPITKFVGLSSDGLDTGSIHVGGAEIVHITTDALEQQITDDAGHLLSEEPTDPFEQILDLDYSNNILTRDFTRRDAARYGENILR